MWVEQLDNGKFKFVERYENPLTGKECRVSTTLEKNNRQSWKMAQEIISKKIEEKSRSIFQPASEYTLNDLVREYRTYQKLSVKKSTYRRNFYSCKTLMNILGADTLVEHLTAGYIKKKFLETGKDAGYLNELLRRFTALIRWGHENDIISDISYLNKLKNFKDTPHRVKIQDKYLESTELNSVLKAMKSDQWILVTKFLALSGLRFGEFCALEKKNVDIKNLQIHVSDNYDSNNKEVTSTKNEFSERDVHIQPELLAVCHEINAFMLRRKIRCNLRKCSLFMFEENGDHIHYDAYKEYLKDYAKKATGKHITPHALRHTHASLLFEQGFTLDEIARRLGHGNSKVTREIYTHVTQKLIEKDNARLDQVHIL